MLGFDALGRLALTEIPTAAQNVVLVAVSGSYAVAGNATGGAITAVAGSGGYLVTGNAAQLAGIVGSGSYAVAGNAAGFATSFIASGGSYLVTGNAVAFGSAMAAESGRYDITGADAGLRLASDPGQYLVTGSDVLFGTSFVAESGGYVVTLGAFELRRTGYDYAPDQYGIGHIKLAMQEARRRAQIVKPTPQPIVSRPPALHPPATVPVLPQVNGLIDDTGFMNRLHAKQQGEAAQAEAQLKQQTRNRTIAVLLLAA